MASRSIAKRVNFLFSFLCSVVLLVNIYAYFNVRTTKISINTLLIILCLTLILIIIAVRINRKNTKFFLGALTILSFSIYILWNLYAKTTPTSDYSVLMEGANKIINGNFNQESFDKASYFYIYNYQIGYTAYLALISKIFGGEIIFFKILDWIYLIATSLIIYKFCEENYTKDIGAISSTLYALYIPNIMGSSVVNNQHLSGVLMIASIYFMAKDTKKYAAIGGILLGLTQIFRPIAIVALIGVIIIYVYKAFRNTKYLEYLGILFIYMICLTMVVKAVDIAFIKTDLAPKSISQSNAKYFKIVLGLTDQGVYKIPTENARKTQVYFDLEKLDFDYDAYNKECVRVIKEAIKNYENTFSFVKEKMYKFLGKTDNQYVFALSEDKNTDSMKRLSDMGDLQYLILLIGALAIFIGGLKRSKKDLELVSVLLIGFILVHIFLETQTRYRYEMYILLVILAGEFMAKFIKKTKSVL